MAGALATIQREALEETWDKIRIPAIDLNYIVEDNRDFAIALMHDQKHRCRPCRLYVTYLNRNKRGPALLEHTGSIAIGAIVFSSNANTATSMCAAAVVAPLGVLDVPGADYAGAP